MAGWRTLSGGGQVRMWADEEFRFLDRFAPGRPLDVRSADGTRIHAEAFGPEDGYPVVLAHGFCCSIRFWAHQITALSATHRVIAFDHRGHGRSGRPAADGLTVPRLGEDLSAVLAAALRPGERALLAGHSMGGVAVQSWAHHHPDEVGLADAIVLINSAPGGIGATIAAAMAGREPRSTPSRTSRIAPRLFRTISGIPIPVRLPRAGRMMSPIVLGHTAAPAARALTRELVMTTPRATRRGLIRALLTLEDGLLDPARLSAPTLVIGSAEDRLLGLAASRRLERSLPNSLGLVVLPDGHSGPLEHPGAVTAELRALADRHTCAAQGA
ncbi:alpha/beta hydrolase [Nocardia sp. NPDC047648]|uniref:alpha/beta fold hydrolase n=1 Tax=Nocardia sp. NPDC047648 TaxID=3155625 RepID=UPI0033E45435